MELHQALPERRNLGSCGGNIISIKTHSSVTKIVCDKGLEADISHVEEVLGQFCVSSKDIPGLN